MAIERNPIHKKPNWVKSKVPGGEEVLKIKNGLRARGLYTVCEEAFCPNLGECWQAKTATLMILGDTCTRACKFCKVKTGNPKGFINKDEIKNSVEMVGFMSLKYVVVTSVDRDDLEDYGAGHFADVTRAINAEYPDVKVEVLIPDFNSIPEHMRTLAESEPFVIAQNLETVERLTHPVRDRRAGYRKTLDALEFYSTHYPHIATKSSLMLGLGEEKEEVIQALKDLREVGVKIVTFGQYLQPSKNHLRVERYYKQKDFDEYKDIAYDMGFDFVASGPMVRSSYKAADYLEFLENKNV